MRKKLLALLLAFIYTNCLANLPKFEVISNGDRGLALEYNFTSDTEYEVIKAYNSESIFIGGFSRKKSFKLKDVIATSTGNSRIGCIAKCDNNGNTLWYKSITCLGTSGYTYINIKKIIPTDSSVVFALVYCDAEDDVPNNSFYYGEKLISPDNHDFHKFQKEYILKINAENGDLIDFVELNNVYTSCLQATSDGGFIYMGCVSSNNEITGNQVFTGLNSDRLKTDSTVTNIMDLYVAKISPKFTLDWDFMLRSHNDNDENGYATEYNYIQGAISKDTLYVIGMMMSDSVDMDPDIHNEYFIKGTQPYSNYDSVTCFIASYDITGSFPKLVRAKIKPFHRWTYNEKVYYAEGKGIFCALNNPNFDSKVNSDDYIYVHLDSSLNLNYDTITTADLWAVSAIDIFHYDSENNFILPNFRYWGNDIPLVFNYSKLNQSREFYASDYYLSSISKFSNEGFYRFSLYAPSFQTKAYELFPLVGSVYVFGEIWSLGDGCDINTDSNKKTIINSDAGNCFIKYHETYKLTAQANLQHGQIAVPDTFGWHGYDYTVSVVADSGYHVERVYTSTGSELETQGNGIYLLKNITEPQIVYADIKKGAGVDKLYYEKLEITPNPVNDYITLSAQYDNLPYVIYTANGKEVRRGKTDDAINVSDLSNGIYVLQINASNGIFRGKFIKQ